MRAALGWQANSGGNTRDYRSGSEYNVETSPDRWGEARKLADTWFGTAPDFDANPGENLFRRLARVQALLLNATDPTALAELRTERGALATLARRLRDISTTATGNARWRAENLAEALERLNIDLGGWLADSPADRLALFRERLVALRPPGRDQLAVRYGGEAALGQLLEQGREYDRLREEAQAAREALSAHPKDPAAIEAARKAMGAIGQFEGYHYDDERLGQVMRDPALAAELGHASDANNSGSLEVPDLVGLAGEEEAGRLLQEAYSLSTAVRLRGEGPIRALARKLIISGQLIPRVVPEELLSEWPDDRADFAAARELVALYDALKARFPELGKPAEGSHKAGESQSGGHFRYLSRTAYALAAVGREAEGVALLKFSGETDPDFPSHAPVEPQLAQLAWDFLVKVCDSAPDGSDWSTLESLAPAAGRAQELIALAKARVVAAPAGSPEALRWQLRAGDALLAAGDSDAALAVLLPVFDAGLPAGDRNLLDAWAASASRLLSLARVLPKPELDAHLHEKLGAAFNDPRSLLWSQSNGLFARYAEQELKAGRFAALEAKLRARLAVHKTGPSLLDAGNSDSESEDYGSRPDTCSAWLADLLVRQGRFQEALQWLAESPHWNESDLAAALDLGHDGEFRPLALVAAEALHGTGRDAEAGTVLETWLRRDSSLDSAYALYTAIRGQNALPFLEQLHERDHFQNRPLIWKASLQLAAGRVAEAEASVRLAIATDPSDGNQPHGDRMRGYAVAAEIAKRQGDTVQAEFFTRIVTAIRQAEAADDLEWAGLTSRAIAEYQSALTTFADAYCIQSRLGRELAGIGRTEEAAEHFRRAYELMPDSFGRVESHCFGCESAFAGLERQQIAEGVFTKLMAKPPVKPQAYYLMGYLREEQGRWDDAAGYFTQAVEADPDYLNAWGHLADALPHTSRPRAELDRVAFRRLALDPFLQHGTVALNEVRDLRGLWQAAAANMPIGVTDQPVKLLPLGDKAPPHKSRNDSSGDDSADRKSPAGLLASHSAMSAVVTALDRVASSIQR